MPLVSMPLLSIQVNRGERRAEPQPEDGWLSEIACGQQQFSAVRRRRRRFWLAAVLLAVGLAVMMFGLYAASAIASGVENSTDRQDLSNAVVSYLRASQSGTPYEQSVASVALTLAQSEVQKEQSFAAAAIALIAAMTGILAAFFVWASATVVSASGARQVVWRRAATALTIAQNPKIPIALRSAQWVEFRHAMAQLDESQSPSRGSRRLFGRSLAHVPFGRHLGRGDGPG
jgi:hypothetical protein